MVELLVEGQSAARYLQDALASWPGAITTLSELVKNGGGHSEIEARLREATQDGYEDRIFVVWDEDVSERTGRIPSPVLANHQPAFPFPRDFEALFPAWMLRLALHTHNSAGVYPPEPEIHRALQDRSTPAYEALSSAVEGNCLALAADPLLQPMPSKVELAAALTTASRRFVYQPAEVRRLFKRLAEVTGLEDSSPHLFSGATQSGGFQVNRELVRRWRLRGEIVFRTQGDINVLDLPAHTLRTIAADNATGPPCWSHDGGLVAFPCTAPPGIRNSEAVRIVGSDGGSSNTLLRVGHYLCWDRNGRLYGNHLGSAGYQVVCVEPANDNRRVLPVPAASIVACIDRSRDRILLGLEGRRPGRVVGTFRVNDGEDVTDGASAIRSLAEYAAPALSPDGRRASWPSEYTPEEASGGLWISSLDGTTPAVRLTPPDGEVMNSTWSPDGAHVDLTR